MKKITQYLILITICLTISCSKDNGPGYQEPYDPDSENPDSDDDSTVIPITDSDLLDLTQRETFRYFWEFANANSGAARERYHPNDPSLNQNVVTTGGSGFGLMAIIVGIERGYITKSEGTERINKILNFFDSATRYHGAWPHWIDGSTGNTLPFSSQDDGGDLVETAFFVQGLICIKEYLKNGSDGEKALANKADQLWKGVEWAWYTQNQQALYWHWSPNHNFNINLALKGYNETLITYVMAAASPDHSITKEVYDNGWASNGGIENSNSQYGIPLLVRHGGSATNSGPLFLSHYSFLSLNPTNLRDQFVNYYDVALNHTNINYQYCVDNPKNYTDYGSDCWGLTASYTRNSDESIGYMAHSPSNDIGVISPTAAIGSIPFTPEKSLDAMQFFYGKKDKLLGPAGFYDAFSPRFGYWVAEAYLAIDQGPQIIMIENYRSGLLWNLFMQNEDVKNGLDKLGFTY